MSFVGQAYGPLLDGTPGFAQTRQTALFRTAGKANPNSAVGQDAFPAEHIIIQPIGK
jgi:hypothetical protein